MKNTTRGTIAGLTAVLTIISMMAPAARVFADEAEINAEQTVTEQTEENASEDILSDNTNNTDSTDSENINDTSQNSNTETTATPENTDTTEVMLEVPEEADTEYAELCTAVAAAMSEKAYADDDALLMSSPSANLGDSLGGNLGDSLGDSLNEFEDYLNTPEGKDFCSGLMDFYDSAVADLADIIPGGNMLTFPLKKLGNWARGELGVTDPKEQLLNDLSDRIDGISGQIDELGQRMDDGFGQVNTRLDGLGVRLDELSGKMNEVNVKLGQLSARSDLNAEWINAMTANTVRLETCRSLFADMDTQISGVTGLYQRILDIENNPEFSPQQKLLELARINESPEMQALNYDLYQLQQNMTGENGALSSNFFECIHMYNCQDVMLSSECFDSSKEAADTIMEQYIAGVLISFRCAEAERAMFTYTQDDLMQLQNKNDVENWISIYTTRKEYEINREITNLAVITASAFKGYSDFVKADRNVFVDQGRYNVPFKAVIDYGEGGPYHCEKTGFKTEDIIALDQLSPEMVLEMAEYIKINYPGMTMRQYLEKYAGLTVETCYSSIYVPCSEIQTRTEDGGTERVYFDIETFRQYMALKERAACYNMSVEEYIKRSGDAYRYERYLGIPEALGEYMAYVYELTRTGRADILGMKLITSCAILLPAKIETKYFEAIELDDASFTPKEVKITSSTICTLDLSGNDFYRDMSKDIISELNRYSKTGTDYVQKSCSDDGWLKICYFTAAEK